MGACFTGRRSLRRRPLTSPARARTAARPSTHRRSPAGKHTRPPRPALPRPSTHRRSWDRSDQWGGCDAPRATRATSVTGAAVRARGEGLTRGRRGPVRARRGRWGPVRARRGCGARGGPSSRAGPEMATPAPTTPGSERRPGAKVPASQATNARLRFVAGLNISAGVRPSPAPRPVAGGPDRVISLRQGPRRQAPRRGSGAPRARRPSSPGSAPPGPRPRPRPPTTR